MKRSGPSGGRSLALLLAAAAFAPLLGGSSARAEEQYKKRHPAQIERIAAGETALAIESLEKLLEADPDDPETLFCLSAARARLGDVDAAVDAARQALARGLPPGRFIAGPRELLAPLVGAPAFKDLLGERPLRLIHGPLVGSVTDRRARIWVRTARRAVVRVVASTTRDMKDLVQSSEIEARPEDDFTAAVELGELEPDTRYYYAVLIDGEVTGHGLDGAFRTFPPDGRGGRHQVGFGGGAGYVPAHERIWQTIAGRELSAFIALGDNVYIDFPESSAAQRYCYYRRQSRPEWRRFTASTPVFAVWDDHDFATNDSAGGPQVNEPAWKLPVWRTFRQNWANPYYGGGESRPGVWHNFSVGDVDFFLLDGRYYRADAGKRSGTMLGPVQKRWLLDALGASTATFKVIASPVPWAENVKGGTQQTPDGIRPGSLDTWDGFPREREEIFRFIEKNRVDGVFLISADRHRSDAYRIDRPGCYPLYEASSSRLTNVHVHERIEKSLLHYNKTNSFGLLVFDTAVDDPELAYHVVDIDGRITRSLLLKRSQISF